MAPSEESGVEEECRQYRTDSTPRALTRQENRGRGTVAWWSSSAPALIREGAQPGNAGEANHGRRHFSLGISLSCRLAIRSACDPAQAR